MNSTSEALIFVFAMGAVIFFCRAFPFLFFARGGDNRGAFFGFVEKIVPPVAMTVLAFNAISGAFLEILSDGLLVLSASIFTALMHLWKRNSLLSIIGGTVLYMVLIRVIPLNS